MMTVTTGLPAGIGLSEVRVYRTAAPDGQCGGTPHTHLACAELYFPLRGRGAVEFLTMDGYTRTTLEPGGPVQFTPGTLHRLINGAEPLELLVVMENGRLVEEGDAVFTFPDEDLADPEVYAELAAVPDPSAVERRRDRAVIGFRRLVDTWLGDPAAGRRALERFHRRAVELAAPRAGAWPAHLDAGPRTALDRLADRTEAVSAGDPSHLALGRVTRLPHLDETALAARSCGRLWPYAVTS
ncbi:cupin domain-containing protein [Streptomyces sp. NPDC000594]|uniref:cupin domain-containing protein n=1 Tax=Streptomyces sp. NPDC000594 TaxID=3154261 RepID=UPI00332E0752